MALLARQVALLSRSRSLIANERHFTSLSAFATVDPGQISGKKPAQMYNLVNGEWKLTRKSDSILDPMNGEVFIHAPDTQEDELAPFIDAVKRVPKSGLHNPYKNPERYLMLGSVSAKAAELLRKDEVSDFFARLIQRTSPKSYAQAWGEVKVTRMFLENFGGDQVRFLARSFGVPGDHFGQKSNGYRWPFGAVACITPFNFPVEIPILQTMGALYMGNMPVLKCDSKVGICAEQFIRMLHACGLPKEDIQFLNANGPVTNALLKKSPIRNVLFTGSARVAEKLALDMHGKVRLEDAGFDWKILGPDVPSQREVDYVAWQSDQDAYACSGQKCSAQSILFIHENWNKTDLLAKMKALASTRKLGDLTVGPVLTVTTERFLNHVNTLLKIPGAKLLFGGKELTNHTIPKCYGAVEPTAVYVPIEQIAKVENFDVCTTEIFGPFQLVTDYKNNQLPVVLELLERMSHHLTAAVVSNDPVFIRNVVANSVNGTTYVGHRARTTGAPQNHWFGPAGDPRGAGIGTPEAIHVTWSCHREVIEDFSIPDSWNKGVTS
eukprot:TRINITY_DN1431_c0_g1::TRINITY_DN1431_c0_g1_i1::g.27105::m.27105 TRINITY_DN1431_c0_g1::TRINITY_DN1431_c0_g1_i1::g.27105  ORF type:complete len:564 (+),score=141.07,sp/Q40255/ALDH_LINUS/66.15/0.0,Aldedh/PF00171.17/1.4e-42 TRINITY_DN1431_c0_g1_i1:42-1694(+)